MESGGLHLLFEPAHQTPRLNISKERLHSSWKASTRAYRSQSPFVSTVNEYNRSVYVAFRGSPDSEIFRAERKFGECQINRENDFFGSLKDGLSDEPAIVFEWVLKRFVEIWRNSTVQDQVLQAQKRGQTIIFTGHSLGGAIAILATLCILEKRSEHGSPFCVTFGCPLIGDDTFARAIRREGWAGRFCHVVSRHDIFSRALLAPSRSISDPLQVLLPYWGRAMAGIGSDSTDHHMKEEAPLSEQQIASFLSNVLQNASAVENYVTAASMAPTSIVMSSIKPLVKLSPYRPFGYYVFCSSRGAICVQNPVAVLQLLFYTLQNSDPSLDQTLDACISDHTGYADSIVNITENMPALEDLTNLAISEVKAAYEGKIAVPMEALGIGIQNVHARLALRAAGELEKRLNTNSDKLDSEYSEAQKAMEAIEVYKKHCKDRGIGYYDSFRLQRDKEDFKANLARLRLAAFWDELVEMVEKHELPDDFQSRQKWIEAGTAYRVLVEPLDIANFYRLGKHEDTGHYISRARPRRYKYVQKWAKDRGGSTQDSCFWAHLEEVSHSMSDPKMNPLEVKSKSQNFQNLVKQMLDSHDLSPDIFLGESSFVRWWNTQLPPEDKSSSPLLNFMQTKGWKRY